MYQNIDKIIILLALIVIVFLFFKKYRLEKHIKNIQEKLSALETGIKTISETKEMFAKEMFDSSIEKKQIRINKAFMTLNESLALITNMALTTIDCFTCAIFLTNKEMSGKEVIKLNKIASKSKFIKNDVTLEPNDNLIGLCFSEQKQILINDLGENVKNKIPYYQKNEDVRSLLALPISGFEKTEGVICIDSKNSNAFNEKDIETFRMLERQVAIALYHARNLDRSEDKTKELTALYEASKALSTPLNVKSVLNTITTLIKNIVIYDNCYIALLEENTNKITIKITDGYDKKSNINPDISNDSLTKWIINNKQPVLYNGNETNSFLTTPMIVKDKVIGIIKLESKTSGFFSEYDKEIISIFANNAAIAIEHAALYEKTILLATTDGLTCLYNHRYFQERLAVELSKVERTKSELTLMLCDIDHFKTFNDTYGHLEGDLILKKFASQLKEDLQNAIIARYGGEEFAAILPAINKQDAYKLADKFRKNVEKNFYKGPQEVNVTISIGIASYPIDSKNQRNLIHTSDLALYRAKESGRNKVCVFN